MRVLSVVPLALLAGSADAFAPLLRAPQRSLAASTSSSLKAEVTSEFLAQNDEATEEDRPDGGLGAFDMGFGGDGLMQDSRSPYLDLDELADELGDGSEEDVEPLADFEDRRPYINYMAMQAAREKYARSETDSGSSEVQIARAHERIKYLTAHLQRHPKDYASRRGLVAIVNKRRRLLNYFFKENPTKTLEMVKELGIRFRPTGAVQTRAEKYAVFGSATKSRRRK